LKKGEAKLICRIMVWAIIATLFFSLVSCSGNNKRENSVNNNIIYTLDEPAFYADVISEILPLYRLEKEEDGNSIFSYINKGYAAEAFDVQALGALESGVASQWYPQYLATVVIAIDRGLTDVEISGWRDLLTAEEDVAVSDAQPHLQLIMSAISYALEGENFSLDSAANLLRELRHKERLLLNTFTAPIIICFDYQAAALIRSGQQLEILVPLEGTLTYEKGILSNEELTFRGDEERALLSAGFVLRNGSFDSKYYPQANYVSAHQLEDYSHLSKVSQNVVKVFRRNVLRTRLYSSADNREHQLLPLLYIIFVVVWLASIISRAMRQRLKRILFLIGIVLLGWIIVRLVKYQMPSNILNRYLWYGYYFFQMALPILLLWLVWRSDKMDDQPASNKALTAVTLWNAVLVAFVQTNDLHNLVFRFDLSNPSYAEDYSYGPVFYIITLSWIAELIAAIGMLLVKSSRLPRKRAFIFPLLFCLIMLVYSVGYTSRVPVFWDSDYTTVVGILSLMFLEISMQSCLVQVNNKYSGLFTHSPLNMQILNSEGKLVLASANAPQLDLELQQAALAAYPEAVRADKDTLLFSKKIVGGYAQWQEDISHLNFLHQQLEESMKKLELTHAVLEEEEKIQQELDEESAKLQVMTELEEVIAADLLRLSSMIESLPDSDQESRESGRIALLLCFVKRSSNLFFRKQETKLLSASELSAYVAELAEIAQYFGMKILVNSEIKEEIPVLQARSLYEFTYSVVDRAAQAENPHLLLHLLTEKDQIVLRFIASEDLRSFEPEIDLQAEISSAGGSFACKDLDGAVGISLAFPRAGE
jgi:hypothetical protein